jgi:hypothetical protein
MTKGWGAYNMDTLTAFNMGCVQITCTTHSIEPFTPEILASSRFFSSCCVQNVGLQWPEQVNIADITPRTRTSAIRGVHITSVSIVPSVTVVSDRIQIDCKEDVTVSNRTRQLEGCMSMLSALNSCSVLLAKFVA